MTEDAWSKLIFHRQRRQRGNFVYVLVALSCCWLCVCLLNIIFLACGTFDGSAPHVSISIALYTLFSLVFLIPGFFVFAIIATVRKLSQRV